MEVAIGSNNSTPFQREIREWQRIDPNTGALLTGRLEADRWINGPLNAYGKVVDSKNVSQPNGTQHTQRKQLEVLQAHTSSGSMQVIRAQTVQTTSSRWSSSKSSSAVSFNSSTKSLTAAAAHLKNLNEQTDTETSSINSNTKKQFKAITNGYSINKNNYNSIHNGDNNQKESNHMFNNNNNNNHNHNNINKIKPQEYNHNVNGNTINNIEQKPSNLSYHLQQMIPTNSPIKTIETTSSSSLSAASATTATIINGGHDHHLNNHLNDYNNCDSNSNIHNKIKQQQQNKLIRTGATKTAAVTKTEPSLKLSNLMKSSQSNNNNDRSSPHSFISTNKNSLNNFSTTLATAAKIKATQAVANATPKTTTIKDNTKNKSSILTKVQQQYEQQQQQQQNQFENGITSSPSMVLSLSSSSSSLLSSSTSTIASVQSFGNNNNNTSNIRTIQQNSHNLFQQQKDKKQKQQQQLPQIIYQQHQPTLVNSSNSNLNSHCVGVTEGITEVGGFKHNNNSSSLITNDGNGYIGGIEEMTMDQPGKYLDFNFQRSRSASIDDLSTDWDEHNQTATDESSEWRRISKIRRSFQFPKTNSPPKSTPLRPIDLPENCVNVSRIREELEKGRRLNTAMSNNTIDLLAMDNILNGSQNNNNGNNNDNIEFNTEKSSKILNKKSPTFLTAESLKEIRGKLKKLSDESLYKDDFIINQSLNNDNIETTTTTKTTGSKIQNDQLSSIVNVIGRESSLSSSHMVRQQNAFQYYPKSNSQQSNHTTNSLENRTTRLKDTSSAEWHIRRKSYGFEKMSPPDNTMFRVENSTDSGLGRSSDLGNLSPTENRATVITFGSGSNGDTTGNINGINKNSTTVVLNGVNDSSVTKPIVKRRYRDPNKSNLNLDESSEIKRHSIAVDETKYVRENLRKVFDNSNNSTNVGTSVHLNRLYLKEDNNGSTTVSLDESQRNQQHNRKRVEFCKTEVHFAAESGRVNIVETDGKPPPSNNFRRRRRSSGNAYIDAITSGLQVMHFGDENRSSTTTMESNYQESDQIKSENLNTTISTSEKNSVTVSIPSTTFEREINTLSSSSYLGKTSSPDDNDEQDEISLRGILKNKPIKPKPYHLGENINSNDSLFGAKLKPSIGNGGATEHTSKLQPSIQGLEVDNIETEKISNLKSVAEHIKIVEERKDINGSYSTKINLNLTDKPFTWNSPTGQISDEIKKPVAVPRKKTTTRPLSSGSLNHNSQLRRIYEMTHNSDMESDDSVQAADEEVKRYLSNELLDQLDDNENSDQVVANSWSRVKTEKQTVKTEKIDIKDIPKSNVMSIQLQSPQSTRKIFSNIHETSKNIQAPIPIAKPRTSIQAINSPMNTEDSKLNRNPIKVSPLPVTQTPQSKLLLDTQKIESNGARKLREHELLYFGIKVNPEEDDFTNRTNLNNSKTRNQTIQSTINETNRKLHNKPKIIEETTQINGSTTKWKLLCDKPDLLRHSPMERHPHNVPLTVNSKDEIQLNQMAKSNETLMQNDDLEFEDEEEEEDADPIYENLKLPYPYNRKDDLIRDEMILSEMAKAADQTMKTVIDAHKNQKRRERRRSAQRHQSQPLDTIEEKLPPTSRSINNNNESEKSYLQQTENSQRRSSLSRRSSSASSTGSFSDSGSICGRLSRSRSKERLLDSKGHSNKTKATLNKSLTSKATSKTSASSKSPIAVTVRRAVEHRSSSRESQRSHTSSNENLHMVPPQKCERRHKRQSTTTSTKPTILPTEKYQQKESTPLSRHRIERSSTESNDRHKISRSSCNQAGTVPSDINHKKSYSSVNRTSATTNSDTTKNLQRISSRSRKDSADNGEHSSKMIRSTSRSSKERHNSERRSASEHRRTGRNSHDRKENSNERHSNSRTLKNEKDDHHRTSTRSEKANRTAVCSDNVRNSKRSHKLEDSNKITQSKDKLTTNDNKKSIQHGTKTAIIPSATSALTTSKTITGKTTAQDGYNDNHHHHHHHHHHQHQHQHHGTTKHITTPSSLSTTKHRTKSKERQSRK